MKRDETLRLRVQVEYHEINRSFRLSGSGNRKRHYSNEYNHHIRTSVKNFRDSACPAPNTLLRGELTVLYQLTRERHLTLPIRCNSPHQSDQRRCESHPNIGTRQQQAQWLRRDEEQRPQCECRVEPAISGSIESNTGKHTQVGQAEKH